MNTIVIYLLLTYVSLCIGPKPSTQPNPSTETNPPTPAACEILQETGTGC